MAITTKEYCTDWMIIKMIIKTTEKNFCGSTVLYRFYEYLAEYHAHRIPRMSVDECC